MNAIASVEEEKTEFTYAELSDEAKEHARRKYCEDYTQFDWWDGVYETFAADMQKLGIRFSTHTVRLVSGKTREDPDIYFSGFWSQGDGACFAGDWSADLCKPEELRGEMQPRDELDGSDDAMSLHHIVDAFERLLKEFPTVTSATCVHRGNYCHEHTVAIECNAFEPPWAEEEGENEAMLQLAAGEYEKRHEEGTELLTETLRDCMRYLYRILESEYNYYTSDEFAEEYLRDDTDRRYDEDGDEI